MVMINIYFLPFFWSERGALHLWITQTQFSQQQETWNAWKNPNKQTNNVSEEEEVEQQENKKKIYVQKQMLESLNSL